MSPDIGNRANGDGRRPNAVDRPTGNPVTRRRFLQSLSAAGAMTAGGSALLACSGGPAQGGRAPGADPLTVDGSGPVSADGGDSGAAQDSAGRLLPGAVEGRVLVVVDLQGGNDGLSTLVPAGDPRYYDLRPGLAVPDDEVLGLDDEVGLHPSLARLHRRGITTVEGVGPVAGDLSHFAMTDRWARGDVTGDNGLRTGFLGRLADSVDDGSPLVGASMLGPSAHLLTDRAATIALGGTDDLWFLEPSDWSEAAAYQRGLAGFDGQGSSRLAGKITESYRDLTTLAADLASQDDREADWEDPMIQEGGQLGQSLYFAAELIAADVGLRVVYAADGDYDTHQNHQWRQADNLGRVDAAVDGFLDRADELGFGDRVLVATISEFGRRVLENDGGLDHGSASTMVLAGPVENRRLGERPPLEDLDEEDNLRVTIGFDRYLAGLAQDWLGVEAASVLPGDPEPLSIL